DGAGDPVGQIFTFEAEAVGEDADDITPRLAIREQAQATLHLPAHCIANGCGNIVFAVCGVTWWETAC
ncbi:MAG: hypothetical protein NZM11_12165, partial [Anaerolineales bacterium]|nr:hypothetical protein [Anaerolineales bacterium]